MSTDSPLAKIKPTVYASIAVSIVRSNHLCEGKTTFVSLDDDADHLLPKLKPRERSSLEISNGYGILG